MSLPPPPDIPTLFNPATCVRKGLCPVTRLRAQGPDILESHSLYFEQHGSGTVCKVVLIMGLNSSCFAWKAQVDYFGQRPGYSVLAFDNRGVGNSGYPRGPYTTSGMAEDAICLLDHLGWTEKREVHVVGISLGGMIAQELAWRIPDRIASLVLAVTTPGGHVWQNFPPWKGLTSLAKLTFTPEPEKKVPIAMGLMFPSEWLAQKAAGDPQGRTNLQVQSEAFARRITVAKPQQFLGHISQMASALTHHVAPDRLRRICSSIPKITIVTGDEDHLVAPYHSFDIKACMPEAECVQWHGVGHCVNLQDTGKFNGLLEKTFREGREASGR